MDTKDVILKLRTESGMSQEELAGKVFVTRQAVSRWENGETVPNTDTLKLLSEREKSLSASAAVCLLKVKCSVGKRTELRTAVTASGAMQGGSICTVAWMILSKSA